MGFGGHFSNLLSFTGNFKITNHGSFKTYIGVDVYFWSSLTSKPDELPGVQLPDDHLPRLLDSSERLGCTLIISVLNSLDLAKDLIRYSADLIF